MLTNRILVVGGAGYIGSHMVRSLRHSGFEPVVLDNLSKGCASSLGDIPLIKGEMGDAALLDRVFSTQRFAAVVHLAAFIEVGESVKFPGKYYQNNVAATLTLLDAMLRHGVKNLIFSSTAAVYGHPQYTPINEAHSLLPINPYGRSKKIVEDILQDYAASDGLRYAALRYFNAAGASPCGTLGECHQPETHLIPLVLQAAIAQTPITVYGKDYPTPDGTCIRDYIHVMDLCSAHVCALQYLLAGKPSIICNLGTGNGYSVHEVISAARRISERSIEVRWGERRDGDPAILVAEAALAKKELDWQPHYPQVETMIRHAWAYLCQAKQPEPYL